MPAIETDDLRFEVEENPPRGRFKLVNEEGQMLGEMIFSREADDSITIEHTEVDDALRGKKGGLRLFQGMVAWARETKTGIQSTCPFVSKMFERDPSSADVLRRS